VSMATSVRCAADGGYRMSQEERDAILGRTMRELRSAREELERLKAEAVRRGERLQGVGHVLASHPEYLVQEGEAVDINFSHAPEMQPWTEADIFQADQIRKLTASIREQILTIGKLNERLKNLGQ
jgi:hypothetical protein